MRILHIVHQLGPDAAGVSAVVRELSDAQRARGDEVASCTARNGAEWSPLASVCLDAWRKIGWAEVVHVHALWVSSTWIGAHVAIARGRPYVLTVHGMLDPWALGQSRRKKRVAWLLAERRIVSRAACVHVLCAPEAHSVRALGVNAPIAIIPPGLGAASIGAASSGDPVAPYVLFLGRIHPKKGVDLLVEAFANVADAWPEWRLVIAGPDQTGMRESLAARAGRAGLGGRVVFAGPVDGARKAELLAGASLFALFSHSEGLPVAAVEAMARGIPVALSHACNLPDVERRGAGLLGADDVEGATRLLRRALSLPASARREMGARGAAWVRERFTSDAMARDLEVVYRDAIAGARWRAERTHVEEP